MYSDKIFVREFLPTVDVHWLLDMKLREADRQEFETLCGRPGNEPVVEAAVRSASCMVALLDGRIISVWGVWDVMATGNVWACGSDEMTLYPLTLRYHAENFFRKCLERWPLIHTYMDSRNTVHARWLRQFKFTEVKDALIIQGVPFHYFRRERQCVDQ